MITPIALAADARALPPLSPAMFALMALLRKESTSADQIEQAILRDAALAANLLRIANSPVFALGRKVNSLSHALTLVGLTRLNQLAVTMSLQTSLPRSLPGYGITQQDFLVHSVAVAFLAERLGKLVFPDRALPFYLAGLLHDIGKLLLARHLQERSVDLKADLANDLSLIAAERDLLGTDHTEVASVLSKAWRLPEEVTLAAMGHHDPGRYLDSANSSIIDIVHVANVTAHALGYGGDVAGLARSPDPGTFRRLGVRPSVIEHLVSECLDSLASTCRTVQTGDSAA